MEDHFWACSAQKHQAHVQRSRWWARLCVDMLSWHHKDGRQEMLGGVSGYAPLKGLEETGNGYFKRTGCKNH